MNEFIHNTVEDIKNAIEDAKATTLRDARRNGIDAGTMMSFPNPYLLAVGRDGRLNPEPVFFRRTPSKRDIVGLSEQYAQHDHTIVACFDLHVGSREMRMAGEMDEPTDWQAEVELLVHRAPMPDEQELIAMSDCESISKPSTGKEENNMEAKSTWTGTPAKEILKEALEQQNKSPITVTEQAVLAEIIRARENGASVVHFDALATDDDTTTFGDLVDALAATR